MNECLFCKIVDGSIPCNKIFENEHTIAFMDIKPISNGHIIIIPKKHFRDLSSCDDDYLTSVTLTMKIISNKINNSKLDNWGINYLSNEGSIAGQEIMHFHAHVIPKYGKNEGLKFIVANKNIDDLKKIEKILKK